jgi:hypothetical protein
MEAWKFFTFWQFGLVSQNQTRFRIDAILTETGSLFINHSESQR